ncbi:MAG: hypothetical protein AAGG38_07125 [Planctomycetota bacterium]
MPDPAHRVRLEGVDFSAAFPTLRLFESFRMALQPTKLLLGLMLLLMVYFGGVALDFIWGPQTDAAGAEYRVFERTLEAELAQFDRLVSAATRLDLGLGALTTGPTPPAAPRLNLDSPPGHENAYSYFIDPLGSAAENPGGGLGSNAGGVFGEASGSASGGTSGGGVIGALRGMVIEIPAWLWSSHPWFFLLLVGYTLLLLMVGGGAIARLAATQACADTPTGLMETARFTGARAGWFAVLPLIPLAVVGAIWLLLAVVGAVLFNVPGLDVVGGLLFGGLLFAGLIGACLLIFTALGGLMLPAALAVEGTDAFDVVSRVSTFLIYRPIRYLVMTAVAVVYGALTYLLVGFVVFLALWFTRAAVGAWVGGFDRLMPVPELGQPLGVVATDEELGATRRASGWLIHVWAGLWFGGSLAYVISYVFTAQTWMYLILRRVAEGTSFEEYSPEPVAAVAVGEGGGPAAEKVEPPAEDGAGHGTEDGGGGGEESGDQADPGERRTDAD